MKHDLLFIASVSDYIFFTNLQKKTGILPGQMENKCTNNWTKASIPGSQSFLNQYYLAGKKGGEIKDKKLKGRVVFEMT